MAKNLRQLIVGNWKMNGLKCDLEQISQVAENISENCDIAICPPFTLLPLCTEKFGRTRLAFGGQDCHERLSGAFTGDISAQMLRDAGAAYVIVGHSERRQYHYETNTQVQAKAKTALDAGLVPIICVGETHAERETGEACNVVTRQLRESVPLLGDIIVAYEPVWAIGTGLTASAKDIAAMHTHIRNSLKQNREGADATRILYGGSVKGANAAEILRCENVDGALVGGASLKAKEFLDIVAAAQHNPYKD